MTAEAAQFCAFGLAPGHPSPAMAKVSVRPSSRGRFAWRTTTRGWSVHRWRVVGSSMIVVDGTDERAVRFYTAHGFVRLPDSLRLVLPMRTLARLVK